MLFNNLGTKKDQAIPFDLIKLYCWMPYISPSDNTQPLWWVLLQNIYIGYFAITGIGLVINWRYKMNKKDVMKQVAQLIKQSGTDLSIAVFDGTDTSIYNWFDDEDDQDVDMDQWDQDFKESFNSEI